MKSFLLLLVLVLAGAGVYQFYLKDHPSSWMPGNLTESSPAKTDTDPKPVAKKDFKEVSALLQGDMDRLPPTLREARVMPSHAFDVKARVAPYLQLHDEYKTLTQVCDTIIGADQDFSERQGKCGYGPPSPGTTARPNPAAYPQQQTVWEGRRRQADSDVRAELATLENHHL